MNNPVEKTIYETVSKYIGYGAFFAGVLLVWALFIWIGWNGFMPHAFHAPTIDYLNAFCGVVLLNFLLAPCYLMQQVKDTSKETK